MRLDTGVNAQFSIEGEQLVLPIRPQMGEVDSFIIYPDPDIKALQKLRKCKTRTELWVLSLILVRQKKNKQLVQKMCLQFLND